MKVLEGVTVVDLGVGMAPGLTVRFLADMGARVRRAEPPGGDPFRAVYPAYDVWHGGAEPLAADEIDAALDMADICITGGEDHPDLPPRRDPRDLVAARDRLLVMDFDAYPQASGFAGRPAVDSLVQARSGMAWEHYSERPIRFAFPAPTYGAVLQGLTGLCAALVERESSGRGQVVSASLFEGALMWMTPHWYLAETWTAPLKAMVPKDPAPLIFRCRDDRLIHFMLGSAGSLGKLHEVLGIRDADTDMTASGLPTGQGDPKKFFGDIERYRPIIAERDSQELLAALKAQGLAAEPVLEPGGAWDDPQIAHNELIVTEADGTRRVGRPLQIDRVGEAPVAQRELGGGGGPLTGLTVVDLGAIVAGPYGSKLMGDLGATVIKIEPLKGEMNRPFMRGFVGCNRAKKAIAIDLKSPDGMALAQRICADADVVQHNFRPGVARRLGVDAYTLHEMNSQLVVAETSGYGADGPKSDQAGFDMVFQALAGHEHRTQDGEGAVAWFRSAMVDFTGGAFAAIGSLLALYAQARRGGAYAVWNNLLDAGVYLLSELVQRPGGRFEGAPPLDSSQLGFGPADRIYRTADGWIAVVVRSDAQGAGLARALSLDRVPVDPITAWGTWGAWDEDAISAAIGQRATEEVLRAFHHEGVWAEPCVRDAEARYLDDRDLQAAGVVVACDDPDYGRLRQIGVLCRFSRTSPVVPHGSAPAVGADTDEIMSDLGYDASQTAAARAHGVIA